MFEYVNTILFNSLTDSTGVPKISFKDDKFVIKRVGQFEKDCVKEIFKRKPQDPVPSKAELDLSGLDAGLYRLSLYTRLSGEHRSDYSNALVLHGKPIFFEVEMKEGETPAQLATKFKKVIDADRYGYNRKLIDVEVSGNKLIAKTANECQLFTSASIEVFDEEKHDFKVVFEAVRKESPEATGAAGIIEANFEGVGTFATLSKSIRLPEMEARRWAGINQEELPIPGAKYVQFTLHYLKDRGVLGTDAMGDTVTSASEHVFFVKEDLAEEFETALAKLGTVEEIKGSLDQTESDIDGAKAPTPASKTPTKNDK